MAWEISLISSWSSPGQDPAGPPPGLGQSSIMIECLLEGAPLTQLPRPRSPAATPLRPCSQPRTTRTASSGIWRRSLRATSLQQRGMDPAPQIRFITIRPPSRWPSPPPPDHCDGDPDRGGRGADERVAGPVATRHRRASGRRLGRDAGEASRQNGRTPKTGPPASARLSSRARQPVVLRARDDSSPATARRPPAAPPTGERAAHTRPRRRARRRRRRRCAPGLPAVRARRRPGLERRGAVRILGRWMPSTCTAIESCFRLPGHDWSDSSRSARSRSSRCPRSMDPFLRLPRSRCRRPARSVGCWRH